jgi:hypothetical protein
MSHITKAVQLTHQFRACACGCGKPIIGRCDRMTATVACRQRISRANAAAAREKAAAAKVKRRHTSKPKGSKSKRPKSKR